MNAEPISKEFIQANGLMFEVYACGQGDKLALCLHGFPEHAISWHYQMPLLAKLGYKVWAPNLRGYGNSSRPTRMRDYCLENLMTDIACLIDASGTKSTHLIAHDWGAIIAWQFAMHKIRPLEKLTILNVPHPAVFQKVVKRSKPQQKKSRYMGLFQIPWLPEWQLTRNQGQALGRILKNTMKHKENLPEEILTLYKTSACQPGAMTAMLNYYRALIRGGSARRFSKKGFPVIETPTLMIWGENDLAVEKETTYGTEAYVKDFRIRYLPGISHWVQQDDPETVNRMLEAWVRNEEIPYAT